MPRIYSAHFRYVTIAAAQDLVTCLGVAPKVCRLKRAWMFMNDVTLETAQGMRLNIKRFTATLTPGSGGGAMTPVPHDNGDAAATFTARINDTTPATTSGAFTTIMPAGGHNFGGFSWNWGAGGPTFIGGAGVILELLGAPSGTCNWSAGMEIEEIG